MRMCVCLSISQHSEANTKTMAISRPTSTPNLPLRPMFQPGSALLSRNLGSASFCQKIRLATTTVFKLYIHSHTHTLSISQQQGRSTPHRHILLLGIFPIDTTVTHTYTNTQIRNIPERAFTSVPVIGCTVCRSTLSLPWKISKY